MKAQPAQAPQGAGRESHEERKRKARELENAARKAATIEDARARSWAYRRAMDEAYQAAERLVEARARNGKQ